MKRYVRYKIQVFRELGLRLTAENIQHMRALHSEIAVDNYCLDLIRATI